MKAGDFVVRVVDDEAATRESLQYMLEAEGWRTLAFESAEAFLAADRPSVPGCLILDVCMDGMSGIELQAELNRRGSRLPVIFFSGHGDIEMAVQSIKDGAADFLTKTVDSSKVLRAVAAAFEKARAGAGDDMSPAECVNRYESLTDREKEIVDLTCEGLLTPLIAERLGITPKTVRGFRVSIYRKLGVRSAADITLFMERFRGIRRA